MSFEPPPGETRTKSKSKRRAAIPRLRLPVRLTNRTMGAWAKGALSLSPEELLAQVGNRSGLSDYGAPDFREPLGRLLEEPGRKGHFHLLGQYRLHHEVRRLLRTRLRLYDLIQRHPEIENQTIEAPIFVIGLPGSGSNYIHQLLSQHPTLRSLPAWEAREPLPRTVAAEPDLDIRDRERRLGKNDYRRRLAIADAPYSHDYPSAARLGNDEELMGIEFSSILLEMKYESASYRHWRMTQSQRPAYTMLRRLLQVLQWLRGGERWILHSSQHIDQLEVLLRVFPDAQILHVHRDPYIVSYTTNLAAHRHHELTRQGGDLAQRNQLWLDRTESRMRSCIRTRMSFPDIPVTDIRYEDYIANPIGVAEGCFYAAGEPMPTGLRDQMKDFHAKAPRGKDLKMNPKPAHLALHPGHVEQRLGFYRDFFAVGYELSDWPASN